MEESNKPLGRVLVIAYYFPPMGLSGVQRIVKFIKYFKEFGWETTVLTINPKAYYAFDNSLLAEVNSLDIKIVRTNQSDITQKVIKQSNKMPNEFYRKIMNRISQIFFLPDNKKSWRKIAVKKGLEILANEKHDIIFATAPPFTTFRIACDLKEQTKTPIVIDYRDAWLDNAFSFYPTPIHRSIIKKMEYTVLRKSDMIVTYTRLLKEKLIKNYPFLNFDDIRIIPHGYDEDDFNQQVRSNKPTNKFRITYTGIFYEFITPKYFIKAVKKLFFERPDLANKMEFCFVGHFGKSNEKLVKRLNLTNAFNIVGYLEHIDSVKYLIDSDALWFMLGDVEKAKSIATGKLFEYFGTRKPILGCVPDGAAKQLLQEYEASKIVPPKDINGIKNALIQLYEEWNTNTLKKPSIEFVERFKRKNLAYELIKVFHASLME